MNTEHLLPLLGEWFVKGFATLLLAAGIVYSWRKASAAQRHFLWLAAMIVLLLLPATRLITPRWRVSLGETVKATAPIQAISVAPSTAIPIMMESAAFVPRASRAWQLPDWRLLLVTVWGAGVAALFGYRLLGSWRLWRMEKASSALDDPRMLALAESVLREFGIGIQAERAAAGRRSQGGVSLRLSWECRVPMTWGIRRTVLVLPEDARNWDDTRLAAALRHEAGHIQRRDYLSRWIAHLACTFYWPNPLVWVAARALRCAQEQATDDLVLKAGTPAEEYAAQLCDAARTVAVHGIFAQPAVAMATPSTLQNRVLAIMDAQRNRRPVSRSLAAAGSSLVLLALAICTAAQMRGADPIPAAPVGGAAAEGQTQLLIQVKIMQVTADPAEVDAGLAKDQSIYSEAQAQELFGKLNSRKGVDLLSAPTIVTRPNQAATVEVVRDFRYPTDWTTNRKGQWAPSAFDVKRVGVAMEANAQMNTDGTIDLRVKPSVVDFIGFTDLDNPQKLVTAQELGTEDSPAVPGRRLKPNFSERRAEAAVTLKPGEMVALRGLKGEKGEKEDPGHRKLVIFVSASVVQPTAEGGNDTPAASSLQEVASKIIIPKLEFREAAVEEAVDFLRKKSRDLSPDGRGVNIVLKLPEGQSPAITLSLQNIPLFEVLHYVAELSNLKLTVQPEALVLGDASLPPSVPSAPSAAMDKARATIIPILEFRNATVTEATSFLRKKSSELDPDKQGVNIIVDQPSEALITLKLSKIPLSEALRYVAELARMEIVSETNAIMLRQPKGGAAAPASGAGGPAASGIAAPNAAGTSEPKIPAAIPVPGKPGFVFSPYDQFKGYIDVRGFPAGTEVKDPYSGKPFLVPEVPAMDRPGSPLPHKPPQLPPGAKLNAPDFQESRIGGRAGVELRQAHPALNVIPTARRPGGI